MLFNMLLTFYVSWFFIIFFFSVWHLRKKWKQEINCRERGVITHLAKFALSWESSVQQWRRPFSRFIGSWNALARDMSSWSNANVTPLATSWISWTRCFGSFAAYAIRPQQLMELLTLRIVYFYLLYSSFWGVHIFCALRFLFISSTFRLRKLWNHLFSFFFWGVPTKSFVPLHFCLF